MSAEWIKDLPWTKIGGSALVAVGAAVGGSLHLGEDAKIANELTVTQTVQLTEDMRHRGEVCPTIAASEDGSAVVRRCASDGCRFVWVQGDDVIFSYYVLAGSRIPAAPAFSALSLLDLPGMPVYAQGNCVLPPEKHGQPDHPSMPFEYLETNPDGWQRVNLRFKDSCVLERYYHRPSGQWSATAWRWVHCVH